MNWKSPMAVLVVAMLAVGGTRIDAKPASSSEVDSALKVQVVDKGWLPIPGMQVTIARLDAETNKRCRLTGVTDSEGYVGFATERQGQYEIRVPDQGSFKGRMIRVRLFASSPSTGTAYVQLRITDVLEHVDVE